MNQSAGAPFDPSAGSEVERHARAQQLSYPAIFAKEEGGAYTVVFPDLPGCITCGTNLDHALKMADEVLGFFVETLILYDDPLPPPSHLEDVTCDDFLEEDFRKLIQVVYTED